MKNTGKKTLIISLLFLFMLPLTAYAAHSTKIDKIDINEIEGGIRKKYESLTKRLIEKDMTIGTMESCTSGLIVCLMTNTEGSSQVVKGGIATYCNEAKITAGVPEETIEKYGVYSKETADQMAINAKRDLKSDIGIGVTGTFGNVDPNNSDSVAGKVYYSILYGNDLYEYELSLGPGMTRLQYKEAVADDVADKLIELLK